MQATAERLAHALQKDVWAKWLWHQPDVCVEISEPVEHVEVYDQLLLIFGDRDVDSHLLVDR